MKKETWSKKAIVLGILTIFSSSVFVAQIQGEVQSHYLLPSPLQVDMKLEESMFRRMSVREFTPEMITDEELSTVLWAACGYQSQGGRTIAGVNGTYSGIIYILMEDAVYTYDPVNHSLTFFKDGDWRDVVGWQYQAPIQLGLCYDTTKADSLFGGAELGQMGQNIQWMAAALDLGTVVCGQTPPAIEPLGIPENQEGMIVMPLGHLVYEYDFKNRPFWVSSLPKIQTSSLTLSEALDNRSEGTSFTGSLTKVQLSQLVWCTYGFSPYVDRSGQEKNVVKRHRTLPSAHGYYPFRMYAVTQQGIFYYQPNLFMRFQKTPIDFIGLPILTFLMKKISGDHRLDVAEAAGHPDIASAPLIMLSVLDLEMTRPAGKDDLSSEGNRRFWYFEAGASAHNVLMEATSWGLSAAVFPPTDAAAIQSLLQLDETYLPFFIIPVGR